MIIIYGGSFDPPHKAHVALLEKALQDNPGATGHVVPALKSPFKEKHSASFDDRLRMCLLAFPFARVDDVERRMEALNPHTFDVVNALSTILPNEELRFLIGSDCMLDLPKWNRIGELLEIPKFEFIVYERKDVLSSTTVRSAITMNAENNIVFDFTGNMLPPAVYEYIKEKRLYGIRA